MPFISSDRLEHLEAENAFMADELASIKEMEPIIALAHSVREELLLHIDHGESFSTREIGELAFRAVLEKEAERARGDLAKEYENSHRHALYDRVVQHVKTEEGEDISAAVQREIESDPELALELRNSARKELWSAAQAEHSQTLTAEQEELVQSEAQRSLDLDRLDVEFAYDGSLEFDKRVTGLLRRGDTLSLVLHNPESNRAKDRLRVEFTWTEDARSTMGWVVSDDPSQLFRDAPNDRFITLCRLRPDLTNGELLYTRNVLSRDDGIELIWASKSGADANETLTAPTGEYLARKPSGSPSHVVYRRGHRYFKRGEQVKLHSINFETRPVEFA